MHDFCDETILYFVIINNVQHQLQHLKKAFKRLSKYALFTNYGKCKFIKSKVLGGRAFNNT